jgi:neutral amino acid transport system substrate-binding protein
VPGCGGTDGEQRADDDIVVGAVLPFTGDDATIGRNLEQAMLLAVEDVNRAGGVRGRMLRLEARDSNSGSERGLDALLDLLYVEQVRYLIGPEENELADEVVRDIKDLDLFNILPGFASPSVERVGSSGKWLRLPPSPLAFGCGLSELAHLTGMETANAVVAQDDFNQSVASEFATEFVDRGGHTRPSVTISAGAESYTSRISQAFDAQADRTLLIVNPTTAATIITEWEISSGKGAWLFGPTLHTPGLLQNVPFASLEGTRVLAPTLSLSTECEAREEDYRGPIDCSQTNAERFADYFAERWGGNRPFPAAHFYYDAVVILAMGLNYARATGAAEPSTAELHQAVLDVFAAGSRANWRDLPKLLDSLSSGRATALVGAAAAYEFDRYGAARHLIFDAWRIADRRFVHERTLQARCLRQPK